MSRQTSVASQAAESPSVKGLAQFFTDAVPLRLPVMVRIAEGATEMAEATVIEFGTPREVLFRSRLPVEFGTRLELKTNDGAFHAEALVIAMQYREGAETAIAARFCSTLANWIVKAG